MPDSSSRFSRADSLETSRFLCELRDAGTCRMLTRDRWIDFNVPEGGALLRGRFDGTEDAFAEAGNGYGYTFPVHRHYLPWLRLDRVLHGPGLRAVRATVTGRRGSDHAAMLVELAVR